MRDVRWKPRAYVEEDLEAVARLRNLAGGAPEGGGRRSASREYFRWKLLENPRGRGGMQVAVDADRIVGMASLTPKTLLIRGAEVNAAEIGDTFTDPEYQRQGIFVELVGRTVAEAEGGGIGLIYGTPNQNSLPGYEKKCNFVTIPAAKVINVVRPLRLGRVLGAHCGGAGGFFNKVSPVLDFAYRLRYPTSVRNTLCAGYSLEVVTQFPPGVEKLAHRAATRYDVVMLRDRAYLSWRFLENPDSYKILMARGKGEPAGYVVAKEAKWRSLGVGYLADFLVDEETPEIFDHLVSEVVVSFYKAGLDMAAAWVVDGTHYHQTLVRRGFRPYRTVPIICKRNEAAAAVLSSPARWHFTIADSDNI